MNYTKSLPGLAAALTLTAGLAVAVALPAQASHGGGVKSSGACSGTSVWTLKAKANDANTIEAEAEVDTNVAGQIWNWKLADNGTKVAKGTSTTAGASGSFTVRRIIADQAGSDALTLRASNPATGEVCKGAVTF